MLLRRQRRCGLRFSCLGLDDNLGLDCIYTYVLLSADILHSCPHSILPPNGTMYKGHTT